MTDEDEMSSETFPTGIMLGDDYVRGLAKYVRLHEKAFADVLSPPPVRSRTGWFSSAGSSTNALRLDPHHLAYLILRFEEAGVSLSTLGPNDVSMERVPSRPMSYISLVNPEDDARPSKSEDDARSILSSISNFSLGSSWWGGKGAAVSLPLPQDARYLYSCFTKLPALQLSPTSQPPLDRYIKGFETLPGSKFVPLYAFKNLQILHIKDLDPRAFLGWDALAESLRSLDIRGSGVEDVSELLIDRVRDDDLRRRGLFKSSTDARRRRHAGEDETVSATLPESSLKPPDDVDFPSTQLAPSKWRQLRHLTLAHNYLTFVPAEPLELFDRLTYLDLSSNLLVAIPAGLSHLIRLRTLILKDNMVESVFGIHRSVGAVTFIDLSQNRLESLAGIDRLQGLERLDISDNRIEDADEIRRLADLPTLRDIVVEGNPFTRRERPSDRPHWKVSCWLALSARRDGDAPDVTIGGQSPSYSERKQMASLRPNDGQSSGQDAVSQGKGHEEQDASKLSPPLKPTKPKRRRQKRIVNLDGGSQPASTVAPSVTSAGSDLEPLPHPITDRVHARSMSHSGAEDRQTQRSHARFPTDVERPRVVSQGTGLPSDVYKPPMIAEDDFRRKVEALRNEVGQNWLAVYGQTDLVKEPSPPRTVTS